MNVCSFTGHRKIEKRHLGKIDKLVGRAIEFAYEAGCRTFLTGGALGFDTVAASRVLLFRERHHDVYLYLLLPCRDQTKGWPEAEATRFEEILSRSDGFRYVQEEYAPSVMAERNRALVGVADVCVAYVRREGSGSGQTVRRAMELGKEIYNLYPLLKE